MRKSRWCHTFIRGGHVAFFHALTLDVMFLIEGDAQRILTLSSQNEAEDTFRLQIGYETFSLFRDRGFLVDANDDELGQINELRRSLADQQQLDILYLLVADGCNLRCSYCFEDAPIGAKSPRGTVMSEKTVEAAIQCFARLVKKYGRDNPEKVIHIYGGEPLLNKNAVRRTVEVVSGFKMDRQLPEATKVVLITNGVLLDKETANYLAAHDVSIGISIDGPQRIHNVNRIAKKRCIDSFAAARNGYAVAKDAGAPIGVSATLTPEVIENFEAVLDFFVNDLSVQNGMSFNILHYNPTCSLSAKYYDDAAKCLIRAFERFRELGLYEERMMRKVSAFVDKAPIFIDCGVGGNQIVVAPDGSIGVCQDFVKPRTYFYGSVFDANYDPFAAGLFEGWKHRSPLFMEVCYNCCALGICGGGCPASAELRTGSRWSIDERICPHSKLSLEWLVWQAFTEATT